MYWIIGSGPMAVAYLKVMQSMDLPFKVIGRGKTSAAVMKEQTGTEVIIGGLEKFLQMKPEIPDGAIIVTGVCELADNSMLLLRYGVNNILAEKPLALFSEQINMLREESRNRNTRLLLAYNRRFLSSVRKAREIIQADGGASSFHFEFTEWSHIISKLEVGELVKSRCAIANSTHVMDLAFHLGGKPAEIECRHAGGMDWHPAAANFAGSGTTVDGALFTYQANWDAPGRWGVEVLTSKHRLILRPLETLQIQEKGSIAINQVEIDDVLDKEFKPGLFRQVKAFIEHNDSQLCNIDEYAGNFPVFCKIAGYGE